MNSKEIIELIENSFSSFGKTSRGTKLYVINEFDLEELKQKLTLTDVSSMFSAKQMEQAFNDGVEAEQQRCCEFDIENYC